MNKRQTGAADLLSVARDAHERIRAHVRHTPVRRSDYFSDRFGGNVFLKLENLQETGSFKLRGAVSKLTSLSNAQRASGCVTASSGNHGAAVAKAMALLKIDGVIFVPEATSPTKIDLIRKLGGDVRLFGTDGLDTELHALEFARATGRCYVSPYNDLAVIAGQGTIGLELLQDLDSIDTVFVAVGGGGLISGIAGVLKSSMPQVRVIACQPERSAVMTASIEAGRILELESLPTLSDGTAGGIEPGAITFDLCAELVDDFITVSEVEIAAAMREVSTSEGHRVEGAAGVALAAPAKLQDRLSGNSVVIICGGNVSDDTWSDVMGT